MARSRTFISSPLSIHMMGTRIHPHEKHRFYQTKMIHGQTVYIALNKSDVFSMFLLNINANNSFVMLPKPLRKHEPTLIDDKHKVTY